MVWSANDGVSIILPSDHVDGDGRNWIMIGEDVPTQIAADFTAALVFHSGSPDQPMFGFDWFAIGISNSGHLEMIGYFYKWSADPSVGGQEQFGRQSFLSLQPPTGVDKLPTLAIGGGIYSEEGLNISSGSIASDSWHFFSDPAYGGYGAGWADYGAPFPPGRFKKLPDGRVRLSGLVKNTTGGNATNNWIFALPAGYQPKYTQRIKVAVANSGGALVNGTTPTYGFGWVDVTSDGHVTLTITQVPAGGWVLFDADIDLD